MAKRNNVVVPEAKAALDKFKMEAAREVGVDLKDQVLRREHEITFSSEKVIPFGVTFLFVA